MGQVYFSNRKEFKGGGGGEKCRATVANGAKDRGKGENEPYYRTQCTQK